MTFPVKRYCAHIILKLGECHHLLLWGVFSRDKFNRFNNVNNIYFIDLWRFICEVIVLYMVHLLANGLLLWMALLDAMGLSKPNIWHFKVLISRLIYWFSSLGGDNVNDIGIIQMVFWTNDQQIIYYMSKTNERS